MHGKELVQLHRCMEKSLSWQFTTTKLCLPAHLSHVVGNVEVHVHADYELHQVLCETDVLVYDGEMERPAGQERRL